jgi:polymorphic toxin system DSP-PTPase phosphatase-like protein
MATRAYWIEGPWRGRLAIVSRPRGGDWLDDEVCGWRESGIDVVVSFLTPAEAAEFALENEGEVCNAHGIRFVSFPIPDQEVPVSKQAAVVLVRDLEQALVEGKNVAVHCRQSIGRSATIATALLVAAGEEPRVAFEKIGKARGCKVPETAEQERWVAGFALELAHPAL